MKKEGSCHHDGNYDNETNVTIECLCSGERTEGKHLKWFRYISGKVVLAILIMGVFIVALAFRLPAKGKIITSTSLRNHDVPFVSQAAAPGVSIAMSEDLNSNIQIYDLDSSGILRVRRRTNSSDQTNTKWISPQIIPTDSRPKNGSPLAAIAFQFLPSITELRVYYLDESNRIVELGASFSSLLDPIWFRTKHFSTSSTGGLAALWLPRVGIRLYFIDENGSVGQLKWGPTGWQDPTSLKLPALATSLLSTQAFYRNPGELIAISLQYVNTDHALMKGQYFPQDDPRNSHTGRIVDPYITNTDGGITSALASDDNPRFWRSCEIRGVSGFLKRKPDALMVIHYAPGPIIVPNAPKSDFFERTCRGSDVKKLR